MRPCSGGRRARRLLGAGAVVLGLAACATRIGGAGGPAAEGRQCATDKDCPQPVNPCQVWTCWEQVCTPVAAAASTLVPREAQTAGDCKRVVCDGQGQTTALADDADRPPDDENPCADEVCEGGEPAYPPVEAGSPCGEGGVCNGRGKCGECLPDARRCQGNAPQACSEEGAWQNDAPCPLASPVCSGAACIGVAEVAAGAGFSCARLVDGTVRCFGEAESGRLGDEGAERVEGLSGVLQVAAGELHTCALVDDGTVKCWGSNEVGQLGDGTPGARGVPAPVPKLAQVTQIAAGHDFTCARLEGGTVVCWGSNEYGQMGGAPTPRKVPAAKVLIESRPRRSPSEVRGLSGAAQLALGGWHGCARLAGGGVSCWGASMSGVLGRGEPALPDAKVVKPAKAPVPVRGLKDVVEVAAGGEHACARLVDGSVACWGRNHRGQLGDGSTAARTGPVKVKDVTGAVGLALGAAHSCAVLEGGGVTCWGAGGSGQLGDAANADHPEPFAVPGVTGVSALASGTAHLCARSADGSVACWGSNARGELGSGSPGDRPSAIVW